MNTDNLMPEVNLHAAGMLCYVKVSVWSARKLDRKQTDKTNKSAGASADASRVNKHLLANADASLKKIQRIGNAIREFIDDQTLPWDNAGYRLLSNARALTVVGEANQMVKEFNAAVDEFIDEYPVLRAQAVANLGDMGDNSEYPQPDQVRRKFSVDLTFSPIPHTFGTKRPGMADAVAAIWENNLANTVQKQQRAAVTAALERLRGNLQRYSERLTLDDEGKPGRFTSTMVDQLNDTLGLIESLAIYPTEEIRQLIESVRRDIAKYTTKDLKGSVAAAVDAKQEADYILQRMQALL